MSAAAPAWLPADFEHPVRVEVAPGFHLRPIRATDLDIDLPAVLGSQPRLWAQFGDSWGWPPATLTAWQDYVDLDRHEQEILRHESFNYALLNPDTTALFGCVYIDPLPPLRPGEIAAEVAWWVGDELVDTSVESALDGLVPDWIAACWPFTRVEFPLNDVTFPGPTEPTPAPSRYDRVRTPTGPVDREAAETMWREYCAVHPEAARRGGLDYVGQFGDSVEMADELVGLVIRGVKTGTAGLLSDFDLDTDPLPRIGGHWIACDGSGAPRVVLQSVDLRLGSIDSVDDAFAWDEGEMDRTRDSWLEGHRRFWQRARADLTETGSPSSEVVFERVRVVWPPAEAARAATFRDSVAAHPIDRTSS
ncbi:MAG: ASCH domain-containing protein [Propionibacteriaceae bacterium]